MPNLTLQQMKEIAEKAREIITTISLYNESSGLKFKSVLNTDIMRSRWEQTNARISWEERINELFKNFDSISWHGKEHFKKTKIVFVNKKFGKELIYAYAKPSKNEIVVSIPVNETNTSEAFFETMLHEFAHIYDYSFIQILGKVDPSIEQVFEGFYLSNIQKGLLNKVLGPQFSAIDTSSLDAYKDKKTYGASTEEVYARGVGPLIRAYINRKKGSDASMIGAEIRSEDLIDLLEEYYTLHMFADKIQTQSHFLDYLYKRTKLGLLFQQKLKFFINKKFKMPNQTTNYENFLHTYLTSGQFEKDWPDIRRSILADPIASETARTINQIAKAETQQASMVAEAKLRKHFKRFL